ncbi:MAG: bifunctional riboflavin kinase/FAD synthetase [Xanthomonadales bacterium]|nr:bifunctional riboflavin kinase/FAD synthetase [Xanthomonadales bacterium]MCE7931903.1 bifunctional riboflavin kinase/FAD synthetase [Xanthomonadales bacterium PRO6]
MMKLARSIDGPPLTPQGAVVAIGAFDGVHLGHQALLAQICRRAQALGLTAAVVCFEPLPRQHFARAPLLRLTPFRERCERIRACGIGQLLCLRFGDALARTSARSFIERVLLQRLAAREVWVGPGFRFGHGREGDLDLLEAAGMLHGFSAHEIAARSVDGERISSSGIRQALLTSDFEGAAHALGRRYGYSGRVVRGAQLGRQLGFPTANLRWPQNSRGFGGIFAVRVDGPGLAGHPGVASLGHRPAVGGKELLLEVHLFDFDGDLYGKRLSIDFVAKQREEWHFPDLASLTAQIRRDADEARAILGVRP